MRPGGVSKSVVALGLVLALCAVEQKHTLVADARHARALAGGSFLGVEYGSNNSSSSGTGLLPTELMDSAARSLANSSVMCVISKKYAPCGSRKIVVDDLTYVGASCPAGMCCSKTSCHVPHGCGNFCEKNWALCSSSIVYHKNKSYGGDCNCAIQGQRCHANADCIEDLNPGGSVRCRCREGFVGTGVVCEQDACASGGTERCGPNGSCVASSAKEYTCKCNSGYESATNAEGQPECRLQVGSGCAKHGEMCSDGKCINDPSKPHGYVCECPPNQFFSDVNVPTCVMTCKLHGGESNCHPGSCRANSPSSYSCVCPEGYRENNKGIGNLPVCERVHGAQLEEGGERPPAGDSESTAEGRIESTEPGAAVVRPGGGSVPIHGCIDNYCSPGKCQETAPGKMECICPNDYVKVYRADTALCIHGPQ